MFISDGLRVVFCKCSFWEAFADESFVVESRDGGCHEGIPDGLDMAQSEAQETETRRVKALAG